MKQSIFKASEALQKWEGMSLKKTRSFQWFLSNSEVEATWASLIGWPHKTSNTQVGRIRWVEILCYLDSPAISWNVFENSGKNLVKRKVNKNKKTARKRISTQELRFGFQVGHSNQSAIKNGYYLFFILCWIVNLWFSRSFSNSWIYISLENDFCWINSNFIF